MRCMAMSATASDSRMQAISSGLLIERASSSRRWPSTSANHIGAIHGEAVRAGARECADHVVDFRRPTAAEVHCVLGDVEERVDGRSSYRGDRRQIRHMAQAVAVRIFEQHRSAPPSRATWPAMI